MFDSGSASLKDYTRVILRELTPYIDSVENRISLSGHTDTTPYSNPYGYSNWELSADRANSARRELVRAGLPEAKISRVVGLSSSVLFDREAPTNPINRRISIIVMTQAAEEAARRSDSFGTDSEMPAEAPATEADPAESAEPAAGQAAVGDMRPARPDLGSVQRELEAAGVQTQPRG
jgi:chemotaxis protein MotB